jgi:hypothetical protein
MLSGYVTDEPIALVEPLLPLEMWLLGYRVRFATDVTGKVKVTSRSFPQMLIRENGFDDAVAVARKRIRGLAGTRMLQRH